MGTTDEWYQDGRSAGGVGTITHPAEPGTASEGGRWPTIPAVGQPDAPWHTQRPRPPVRPGRPRPPVRPGRPVQPGRVGRTRPPATAPEPAGHGVRRQAARGLPARSQRMPFAVLLCGLLGGALICALVISTMLAAGSFQITRLQQANTALARQRQLLQEQVAAAQSPQVIQERALQLGMRQVGEMWFLNLRTGKVQNDAGSGAVADIHVPGYTP